MAKAVAESDNLPIMLDHLAQLLVAALEMKGCTIFVLDREREELEPIASFGLSAAYQRKGTISANQSIGCALRGEPVIIRDLVGSDRLRYPDAALKIARRPESKGKCIVTILPSTGERYVSTELFQ